MRDFANEVVEKLALMGQMEKIAVETTSAQASAEAQVANVKAAHLFYEVLQKKAEAEYDGKADENFCDLIEKVAELTGKEGFDDAARSRVAAAVLVDEMLTNKYVKTGSARVASIRAYGREFITSLLQEALQ